MDLAETIISAENKYKDILEEFFINIWGNTNLTSHGLDHHRRVWQYAKELLTAATGNGEQPGPVKPDKLMIACYLHDLGMSEDPDIRHGKMGRDKLLNERY
ncbi:MAG: HD domain-containing protein [Bacteroidales bacterium]